MKRQEHATTRAPLFSESTSNPDPDIDEAKKEVLHFDDALIKEYPQLYVTPTLIGINAVVYILMCINGVDPMWPDPVTLLYWGANYGALTHWQWWRLVTCVFVHAGLIHIALNMLALWTSGRIVERLYGPFWFLLLYMLSGIGASLVSLWSHPALPSVGASGAIVGVYGCLLAFMLHPCSALSDPARKVEIKSLLAFFAYLMVQGLRDSTLDTAGHVGGAIIGFVIGSTYSLWIKPHLPHAAVALSAHKMARAKA